MGLSCHLWLTLRLTLRMRRGAGRLSLSCHLLRRARGLRLPRHLLRGTLLLHLSLRRPALLRLAAAAAELR